MQKLKKWGEGSRQPWGSEGEGEGECGPTDVGREGARAESGREVCAWEGKPEGWERMSGLEEYAGSRVRPVCVCRVGRGGDRLNSVLCGGGGNGGSDVFVCVGEEDEVGDAGVFREGQSRRRCAKIRVCVGGGGAKSGRRCVGRGREWSEVYVGEQAWSRSCGGQTKVEGGSGRALSGVGGVCMGVGLLIEVQVVGRGSRVAWELVRNARVGWRSVGDRVGSKVWRC